MEGGQIMVVAIVALVMAAGVIKAAIYGKNGAPNKCGPKRRRRHSETSTPTASDETLSELNAQLDKVIDRLAVLEKIVTDEDRTLRREFDNLEKQESSETYR